ncbi:MAG: methionyl-tRNA formyltransferase [Patescibacteria group bacterium]
MIRYVFFGSPEFAATILQALVRAGLPPSVVVTNPDRPVGRKKVITSPPAKVIAETHNIPVWQPEQLEIGNWKLEIGEVDFAVVAAYSKILPKEIVEAPRLGIIGVHPSLLPKYRGATPIQSAILGGETETGVTLYLMDEKVDHGPILATSRLPLATDDTYNTLERKLAEIGGKLLVDALPKFLKGEIHPHEQDHDSATFTKKFKTEDGYIPADILRDALSGKDDLPQILIQKIRALGVEPGVYTELSRKRLKLLDGIILGNRLVLTKVQLAGEKPKEVEWTNLPYN